MAHPSRTRLGEADASQAFRFYTKAQQEYDQRVQVDAAQDQAEMKDQLESVLHHANDEDLLRFLGIKLVEVPRYITKLQGDVERQAHRRGDGSILVLRLQKMNPRKEVNVLRSKRLDYRQLIDNAI